MSKSDWADLDITKDELDRFSKAFKSTEFRKLFAEYCQEISDPVNRQQYEQELTQLEAERGIKVTFINPEPGYVIKTSVNGDRKAFINVAKCDKVRQPTSVRGHNEAGDRGLHWNIPYTQAPARCDVDHSGAVCPVYDVVFHPHTLHLASKNGQFRKLVTQTACEAVQQVHGVEVDTANLKFPKMSYKGMARPTIIRERNGQVLDLEPSPLDEIYPPLKEELQTATKKIQAKVKREEPAGKYATPKYHIVHRRDVELHEMTNELDAKINLTIPKELSVVVDLPLLKSTKDVTLDVTAKTVHLISEVPAKYKLKIDLPFDVDETCGKAKFDAATRKLEIILPVVRRKKLNVVDLCREDSGVESDHASHKEDSSSSGSGDEQAHLVDGCDDVFEAQEQPAKDINSNLVSQQQQPLFAVNYIVLIQFFFLIFPMQTSRTETPVNTFLDSSIAYNQPPFAYNRMKNTVALTLHVKNVAPESIILEHSATSMEIKFISIGAGHFPNHYAFYFGIPADAGTISDVRTEAWDNNVIIQLDIAGLKAINVYQAGLSKQDYQDFPCPFTEKGARVAKEPSPPMIEQHQPIVADAAIVEVVAATADEIQIDISGSPAASAVVSTAAKSKKHKKSKKKRSYSESHCEQLMADIVEEHAATQQAAKTASAANATVTCVHQKSRSVSESSNDDHHTGEPVLKGILKRRSSYNRSPSECSVDEAGNNNGKYSCSMDLGIGSFSSIPEERGGELSESVRKTVTFDKNLCRKLLFK